MATIEEKVLAGEVLSADEMAEILMIPESLQEVVFEALHDPFVKLDKIAAHERIKTTDGKVILKMIEASARSEKVHFDHRGSPSSTGGTYELRVPRSLADPENPKKRVPNPNFERIVNAVQEMQLFSVQGPAKHRVWRRDVVRRLHFVGERGSLERQKSLSLLAAMLGKSIDEVTDKYDANAVLTADIDVELQRLTKKRAELVEALGKAGVSVKTSMSLPQIQQLVDETAKKLEERSGKKK